MTINLMKMILIIEKSNKIIDLYILNAILWWWKFFPFKVKELFHQRFPNINISNKEIEKFINVKYRDIKKIYLKKIINTESLNTIEYDNENNHDKKSQFL